MHPIFDLDTIYNSVTKTCILSHTWSLFIIPGLVNAPVSRFLVAATELQASLYIRHDGSLLLPFRFIIHVCHIQFMKCSLTNQ
jgi:hypothetical protein